MRTGTLTRPNEIAPDQSGRGISAPSGGGLAAPSSPSEVLSPRRGSPKPSPGRHESPSFGSVSQAIAPRTVPRRVGAWAVRHRRPLLIGLSAAFLAVGTAALIGRAAGYAGLLDQ